VCAPIVRGAAHPAVNRACTAAILLVVDDAPSIPAPARDAILTWYSANGRSLAFRRTTDPYAVLVSEAMAQQTQAARAAAHWERFMERFPTVESLAAATPADVLRQWQGLGYNRRALALWRAAGVIVRNHDRRVPDSIGDLEALPGVGPYTARAVAAIAFGRPVGAVDVNVARVLGRLAGGRVDVPRRDVQALADATVASTDPAAWTHAAMDLGATICRAREPQCGVCPARPWCRYTAARPVPKRRGTTPPFPSTTRWLRGRILDRLRAAPGDAWVDLDAPIGNHDLPKVVAAVRAMAADGLVELATTAPAGVLRARLPTA
jgi:A/G-specific adenine glycosylase